MPIDARKLRQFMPTMLLGALNGGIAIGVLVLAFGGTRAAELLATPAKSPPALVIELAHAPPAADLAAIQAQPLMHATRAFHVAPAPDPELAPPLPVYRLAGSLILPNKPAVALLSDPQSGVARRIHNGDEVDGWRVQAIEGKRVVLRWQEQTREIGVAAVALSTGLKRVPMQRSRLASVAGTIISLGAEGTRVGAGAPTPIDAPQNDRPRAYRPPPN